MTLDVLITCMVTLLLPELREDEEIIDEVLTMVLREIMSHPPEERSKAVDQFINTVHPLAKGDRSLRTILSPLL